MSTGKATAWSARIFSVGVKRGAGRVLGGFLEVPVVVELAAFGVAGTVVVAAGDVLSVTAGAASYRFVQRPRQIATATTTGKVGIS